MNDPLMTEREQAMEQELQREAAEEAAFLDAEEQAEREDFVDDEPSDGFLTDAEADGDALASAGRGTDEDYEHNLIDDMGHDMGE